MKFTAKEFVAAYELIKKYLPATPLIKNDWLSTKYQANVYLKLENLQPVGSFKLRGALHKISTLTKEEAAKGILAVSAGNHAQGVAWAAQKFKVAATVIMPRPSPMIKVSNTRAFGAEVILEGENVDESFEYAKEYQKQHDKTFIHPFFDKQVILGQGSIALELREQIDSIDFLFGSIGGGGLVAGCGHVLRPHFPQMKLIASQAAGAPSMVRSLQEGKLIETELGETFADGIKVKKASPEMFSVLDEAVDEAVLIADEKIATAVLELMEQGRIVTEGAAAINLAAFKELHDQNPRRFHNKNIVILICGGNIDINLIDRIIDQGLIQSKRRVKLALVLKDRPGALMSLTKKISKTTANVLDVRHDRNSPLIGINESLVEIILETRGEEHAQAIIKYLEEDYRLINP